MNPEVLRTFDGGRSPSLIAGHLEPATRLDKRGERYTEGIRDGVVTQAISDRRLPCRIFPYSLNMRYSRGNISK